MRTEQRIGRWLAAQGTTLAVAESCTGGLLGGRLTSVPGSSQYFLGGVIAYANEAKTTLAGVPPSLLRQWGAVSAPVAARMAEGVRRRLRADLGVGITGIAGPGGGTRAKPVGLVFVAVADRWGTVVRPCRFSGPRATVRRASVEAALQLVEERLTLKRKGGR